MTKTPHKMPTKLSLAEEIGNAVSHGAGALIMLVLLPISAIYSYTQHGVVRAVGVSIFVISLFLMFLSSSVYHAMRYGSLQKYVLRILDHSMIFIAIAGSYTPVVLALIPGPMGYTILAIEWAMTIGGIIYKSVARSMNKKISLAIYITMGWLVIFALPTLITNANLVFLILITAGGLLYTIGAVFYARKKPYAHLIWHFFILSAAITHYIAIVFFL